MKVSAAVLVAGVLACSVLPVLARPHHLSAAAAKGRGELEQDKRHRKNPRIISLPRKVTPGYLPPLTKGPLSGRIVIVDPGHCKEDPGSWWNERFPGSRENVTFWESSITYPASWELAGMLRREGAGVYLSTYSEEMEYTPKGPREILPIPSRPRYTMGRWRDKAVKGRLPRIRTRNYQAAWIRGRHPGRDILFLALHVDAASDVESSGAHVCIPKKGLPPAAPFIAKALGEGKYLRDHMGKKGEKGLSRRDKRVGVLWPPYGPHCPWGNRIPDRVLVEMGVPQNPHDSWLLRNRKSRGRLLRCIVQGIVSYAASAKKV